MAFMSVDLTIAITWLRGVTGEGKSVWGGTGEWQCYGDSSGLTVAVPLA
jgi:hypothetical protein